MRRRLQIGVAALLLIAAVATLGLVLRKYRRDSDEWQLLYAHSVKRNDIVDAARNALSALISAEIHEQDYVLTGETVYSEAYAEDVRDWQDESAALELVAKNDPATVLAQDFSKAGKRTLDELAQVVSLYEKGGREAALDRIRKSSGIVYLDQARDIVVKIREVDGGGFYGTTEIITRAVSSFRRLAAGASALFLLSVAGTLLLIVETRRVR